MVLERGRDLVEGVGGGRSALVAFLGTLELVE